MGVILMVVSFKKWDHIFLYILLFPPIISWISLHFKRNSSNPYKSCIIFHIRSFINIS